MPHPDPQGMPVPPHRATPAPDGAGLPAGGVVVVMPAKDEAPSLPDVLGALPTEVCGLSVSVLVVDDGSTDGTPAVARAAGARVGSLPSRGQGVALRTGYRLALDAGARVVVSMDADGQHRPDDLAALVAPVVEGRADVVQGSRVLGSAAPNARVRELGVTLLAGVMAAAARRDVTDPSCGYRATSGAALRRMHLVREQFHTAEFLVHAARLGLRVVEVPVRIDARAHGVSRKPPTLRYAVGFTGTIVRTWARGRRGTAALAAVAAPVAGPAARLLPGAPAKPVAGERPDASDARTPSVP